MHSSIDLFLFFSFLILFCNPKNIRPLVLSSSFGTKFEFHSLPHGNLTFLGDSHLRYDTIILTKEGMRTDVTKEAMWTDASRSAGVVLYKHPILFLDPRTRKVPSFHTMFAFSIRSIQGDEAAFGDGLAFLISPDDHHLGSPGYLGLIDSTGLTRKRFVAIEFDTKRDSMFQDPDDNHVGLDINSLFSVKLATSSSLGVNLKSGTLISTWIHYNSSQKRLEVFLSASYLKPKKPILKVNIDLSDYLKDNMFVGFSAATEGSMQSTRIAHWEFTTSELSPPPPSPPESGNTFTYPTESGHKHGHVSKFAIVLTVGVCSVPFMVLFGWFCWKKLVGMIQTSEGTNNLEMETIRSSGGFFCEGIRLCILLEVARGLNIERVLDSVAELIRMKTVKSSIPLCNSLPVVKPSIYPLSNNFPTSTNDTTPV